MTQRDADVLIVGAGPVGLTLANDLAARGVSFRIIDQLPAATTHSKAHGFQSRTLEALDRLNLAEPILEAAQHPQPPFVIYSGKKMVTRLDFAEFLHQPYPYQLVIWQQQVERVLEAGLARAGKSVERSTRLMGFDMNDEDGVVAQVERGASARGRISANWIVGCDGGHSTVRETLGLQMEGKTLPGRFWLGEFDISWNRAQDSMYEWWHPRGVASAIFVDFTNKWHITVETDGTWQAEPNLEQMQQLFREHTGEHDVVLSNPAWISALTINQRMANRFIVGHAILAGDAAHVHTGAGGQGMNTGIQDALNLGWKLALVVSGAAPPTLLQTYESERLPNARQLLKSTLRYHRIELPRGRLARWISGTFFRTIHKIWPIGYAVARRIGMLDLNYAGSSLSWQASQQGTPKTVAGWHVPDVPCRVNGKAGRLFEILRGTCAVVLLFAGTKPTEKGVEALRTVANNLRAFRRNVRTFFIFAADADASIYGNSDSETILDGGAHLQTVLGLRDPEILFVRPDGYIGLRADSLDGSSLERYLGLIFSKQQFDTVGTDVKVA